MCQPGAMLLFCLFLRWLHISPRSSFCSSFVKFMVLALAHLWARRAAAYTLLTLLSVKGDSNPNPSKKKTHFLCWLWPTRGTEGVNWSSVFSEFSFAL